MGRREAPYNRVMENTAQSSFYTMLKSLKPESRVRLEKMTDGDLIQIEIVWNDVCKAALLAVGTVSAAGLSPVAQVFLIEVVLPELEALLKDKKTFIHLTINDEFFRLGNKAFRVTAVVLAGAAFIHFFPKAAGAAALVGAALLANRALDQMRVQRL